jgi:hypothetical protein
VGVFGLGVFGLGVLGAGIVCWVGAWRWDEIGCAGRLGLRGLRGWARGLCAGFQHQTVISNIVIIDYINRNIIKHWLLGLFGNQKGWEIRDGV